MAINLETQYTNSEPASAEYPQGSFKNASTPSSQDGTPVEKAWGNDIFGFFQRLLALSGITPSGAPDNAVNSDYANSLDRIFSRLMIFNDTGTVNAYSVAPAHGAPHIAAYFDGMIVIFKAVNTNTDASTLKVGSLAAKSLTLESGVSLPAAYVVAGQYCIAVYRLAADRFELIDIARKSDKKPLGIGPWNMDTTATVWVTHGLSDITKMRSITGVIQNDNGNAIWPITPAFDGSFSINFDVHIKSINPSTVAIGRKENGSFDDPLFSSMAVNRGWLHIELGA